MAVHLFDGGGHNLSPRGPDPFHREDERWSHNVDVERLTRIVRAFNELSEELADAN